MLGTITSTRAMPFEGVIFDSNSRESEKYNALYNYFRKGIDLLEILNINSMSSPANTLESFDLRNETFDKREAGIENTLEYDVVVRMPPKNRIVLKARVFTIRKAEISIVEPVNTYFEM